MKEHALLRRHMTLKGMLIGLCMLVVTVYVAVCIVLFTFQRSLIYHPRPRSYVEGITLLTLAEQGARVLVSSHPYGGPKALLYFGGNAEDVSQAMPDMVEAFPRRAIYLMHYRGYGGSSGTPSEKALVSDALALFDMVQPEHPNVVVVGRSLGSGIAVQIASARPVERLILVTPFDSLESIGARQFSFLPVSLLLRDKFESWRYAARVNAPTLILAGDKDTLVPLANSERLKNNFRPGVAVLKTIAGAGHNDISESPEYARSLADQNQR